MGYSLILWGDKNELNKAVFRLWPEKREFEKFCTKCWIFCFCFMEFLLRNLHIGIFATKVGGKKTDGFCGQ